MANHCVYEECFACKTDYCTRCSYTCNCGKEAEDPEVKRKERESIERYYRENPMPDGWF